MFLLKLLPKLKHSSTTAVGQTRGTGTDGDDFFAFSMDKKIATPYTNSTNMECLQYLEDKTHSLEALHKFSYVRVKNMFVK